VRPVDSKGQHHLRNFQSSAKPPGAPAPLRARASPPRVGPVRADNPARPH
jgi:hypothetical protein